MEQVLFSGKGGYKPQVSVWEKLRRERIADWNKIKQAAEEVGYKNIDVQSMSLQELNDILRKAQLDIKNFKKQIEKEERIEKVNAIRANRATSGSAAHERYKMIMEMMVKGSKSSVRSMDSQDVFAAFDEISNNADGKLINYQQFLDATAPKDLNMLDPINWEL